MRILWVLIFLIVCKLCCNNSGFEKSYGMKLYWNPGDVFFQSESHCHFNLVASVFRESFYFYLVNKGGWFFFHFHNYWCNKWLKLILVFFFLSSSAKCIQISDKDNFHSWGIWNQTGDTFDCCWGYKTKFFILNNDVSTWFLLPRIWVIF